LGLLLTLAFLLCCLVLLLTFKNVWVILFLIVLFALFTIASRNEAEKKLEEEEKKAKKEEILDEKYPNPFLNSAVMFSDPKWAGAVRYGDALMTDLMQHLLMKLRDLDEMYDEKKEPEKTISKTLEDLSKVKDDIANSKKKNNEKEV